MRKIRQHNDIDIVVLLKDEQGGVLDPTLNSGYSITVHTPSKKISITDYQLFADGRIAFRFQARDQVRVGVYSITITAKTSDGRVFTTDVCNAFALVTCSCETEKGSAEVELVTVETEASFEITAWGGDSGGEGGAVPVVHTRISPSTGIVQIIDVSSPIGYSVIAVNEDVSEFYLAPSYFVDGSIIVCNIDYTYKIDLDTDDESNLIGSIAEKLPTKSQVYATKEEVNGKLGDINTILVDIING